MYVYVRVSFFPCNYDLDCTLSVEEKECERNSEMKAKREREKRNGGGQDSSVIADMRKGTCRQQESQILLYYCS
ncbi:hypothetical protein CR513_29810, partial [Mucuna pruriens]